MDGWTQLEDVHLSPNSAGHPWKIGVSGELIVKGDVEFDTDAEIDVGQGGALFVTEGQSFPEPILRGFREVLFFCCF